jgi:hypothetical protein
LVKLASVVVLGLTLLRPSIASADTLTLKGLGMGETLTLNLVANGVTTTETGFVGQLNWMLNGTESLLTYCVDLFDNALLTQNVTVGTTNDLSSATDPYVTAGAGGRAAFLIDTFASAVTNNAMAAGLQIALWQTLYTSYDATKPAATFSLTGASADALKYADIYFKSVTANSSGTVAYLDAKVGQDQIVTHVPEPASIFLTGGGLLLAGLLRRRRKSSSTGQVSA